MFPQEMGSPEACVALKNSRRRSVAGFDATLALSDATLALSSEAHRRTCFASSGSGGTSCQTALVFVIQLPARYP